MFAAKKKQLIDKLIKGGYIKNKDVISAMEQIPREVFVPDEFKDFSYSDTPLRIGTGQTISAPHMVGMMLELIELKKGDKVLEVGGGSGYHASIAAAIVGDEGHVYSVEIIEELAIKAEINIKNAGMQDRVSVVLGDGSKGLEEHSPFDKIMVACGAPSIPRPLIDQLKDGGIMILPVGGGYYQTLVRVIKKPGGEIIKEDHGGCAFVPMVGEYGT